MFNYLTPSGGTNKIPPKCKEAVFGRNVVVTSTHTASREDKWALIRQHSGQRH